MQYLQTFSACLRQTTTGIKSASLSPLAFVNVRFTATVILVVTWPLAIVLNSGVLVIQTRSYDGQDGQKRYVTEVVADNVTFLGSKNNNTGSASFTEAPINNNVNQSPIETTDVTEDPFKNFGSEVVLTDDDLPF